MSNSLIVEQPQLSPDGWAQLVRMIARNYNTFVSAPPVRCAKCLGGGRLLGGMYGNRGGCCDRCGGAGTVDNGAAISHIKAAKAVNEIQEIFSISERAK